MEVKESQKVDVVEKGHKKKVSTLTLFLMANVIAMWGILALALVFYFPYVELHPHGDETPYIELTIEDRRANVENKVEGAEYELARYLIYDTEESEEALDEAVDILMERLAQGDLKALTPLGTLYWAGRMGIHTFDVAYALWAYALENGIEEPRYNFEKPLQQLMSPNQKENGELLLSQMKEFGVTEALKDYVSN